MKSIHVLLVSDQLLPNLIPALMSPPARAYLVSTKEMREKRQLARLADLLRAREIDVRECSDVPSSNMPEIRDSATELACWIIEQEPQTQLVLNVTGGTKLLAMGFTEVFREVLEGYPLDVIYTDTANQRLETLVPRNRPPQSLSHVLDVPTYLAAQGITYRTARSKEAQWRERVDSRKQAAKYLGQRADKLDGLIGALNALMHGNPRKEGALSFDGKNLVKPGCAFERDPKGLWREALLKCVQAGLIEGDECREFQVKDADSARFLGGLWLEEYAWHCASDGGLHDVRCGVEFTWESIAPKKDAARNELDLLATHNNRMLIVECKTQNMEDEENRGADKLTKLESLARHAGGLFGSSLLLSARTVGDKQRGRCRSLGIQLLHAGEIKKLPIALANWRDTGRFPSPDVIPS